MPAVDDGAGSGAGAAGAALGGAAIGGAAGAAAGFGAAGGSGVQPAMSKASRTWRVRAGSWGRPLAETLQEENTAITMARIENILKRLQARRRWNILMRVLLLRLCDV